MQTSTNVVGVHALVWAGGTSPQDVEYAVQQTAAAGYDLLELSLHDLPNLDVDFTRDLLTRQGLQVACSRGLGFDADVSSDDTDVVQRGKTLLLESLEATDRIGARQLTGALYSALGKYGHPLTPRGRQNAVTVLRGIAQDAAQRDISIGLEVCNRYETNVVNTAHDVLRLADDIGEDNVFIHLDTFHMNIEEDNLTQPVLDVGDRLGYVHVGECHRGYLGSGSIDFPGFFRALNDIDYTGPITFESFSSAVVSETLSNDLAIWRNLWDDGADLAAHAKSFIDAQLDATRT